MPSSPCPPWPGAVMGAICCASIAVNHRGRWWGPRCQDRSQDRSHRSPRSVCPPVEPHPLAPIREACFPLRAGCSNGRHPAPALNSTPRAPCGRLGPGPGQRRQDRCTNRHHNKLALAMLFGRKCLHTGRLCNQDESGGAVATSPLLGELACTFVKICQRGEAPSRSDSRALCRESGKI